MIQIRTGTFETNSSSSHSLVIAPKAYTEVYSYMKNEIPDYRVDDGVFYLGRYGGLYFGRFPFQVLYTMEDKIRYAYACFEYDVEKRVELIELIKKLNPKITRVSEFEYKYDEDRYLEWVAEGKPNDDYFYVEHPSVGTDEAYLQIWMKQYNFTLEEFITNPHYVVIVDGDEYNYFKDMWKLGIVKEDMYQKKAWE